MAATVPYRDVDNPKEQTALYYSKNGGEKTMQTYTYVSKGKFELREKIENR